MNNGVKKDKSSNEPRIGQTKPDKKKKEKEIGGVGEEKRQLSGLNWELGNRGGGRGRDSRREAGGHQSNGQRQEWSQTEFVGE